MKITTFFLLSTILALLVHFSSCEDFEKQSDRERGLFDYCLENLEANPVELKEGLIGRWELIGFACDFSCTEREPSLTVEFSDRRGTLAGYYDNNNVRNVAFTWYAYLDTTSWGNGIDNVLAARIRTEPSLYEISNNFFCDRYMFHDRRIGDGYFMLFEKVD